MKKHAIIPIFIPHRGCPNDCVFCNQKAITARTSDISPQDVRNIIEQYLPTLQNRGLETIEVAFFGGSFTGIPMEEQSAFLKVAKEYKDKGLVDKIHMSTRPDYISREILDNLIQFDVDIIELGVQSFNEEVLELSNRGHKVSAVYEACSLIKEYGIELGIQLMIGLPGDSLEKCIYSAKEAVKLKPSVARLYPTIVLEDTELIKMYNQRRYHALTTDEAVAITKEMYKILYDAGINIIRVGLKSTDLISGSGNGNDHTAGHTYHPAFRQLVEGEIARENIESMLTANVEFNKLLNSISHVDYDSSKAKPNVNLYSNGVSFSNMIGNARRNKLYFEEKYPTINFKFKVDESLKNMEFAVSIA